MRYRAALPRYRAALPPLSPGTLCLCVCNAHIRACRCGARPCSYRIDASPRGQPVLMARPATGSARASALAAGHPSRVLPPEAHLRMSPGVRADTEPPPGLTARDGRVAPVARGLCRSAIAVDTLRPTAMSPACARPIRIYGRPRQRLRTPPSARQRGITVAGATWRTAGTTHVTSRPCATTSAGSLLRGYACAPPLRSAAARWPRGLAPYRSHSIPAGLLPACLSVRNLAGAALTAPPRCPATLASGVVAAAPSCP